MRKKFTMLLAALLACVGVVKAQNVVTSTEDAPVYYVIASYDRGGVITYSEIGSAITHAAHGDKGTWYFEAVQDNENNGVYIVNKNKSDENKLYIGSDKKVSTTPAVWYILPNGVNDYGYSISSATSTGNSACLDANNGNTGIGGWSPSADDWQGTTWVFYQVGNATYNPNEYVVQQGTGGRYISSITVNGVTKSIYNHGLAYADHTTRVEFKVAVGSDVAVSIGKNGNWMQAFAYVDFDGDGFATEGVDEDGYTPTGDLVTYSCYDADNNEVGVNSKGEELSADARNTVVMPDFTAPATLGTYRLRVKYDWNDLNPNGGSQFATAGSQFVDVTLTVVDNPLAPVIPLAEALYASVANNVGDAIGEYPAETVNALAAAIEVAKAIADDAATADDVATLQAAMDAVKVILPTVGKYYQFHSSLAFNDGGVKAVYSNGSAPGWKTVDTYDKSFYWQAVETAYGVALQNVADSKYLVGNAAQSGAWTMADEPSAASAIDVKTFSKTENEKGYEYGVVLNDWQMHCNGHGGGTGTASNIVSWNTDAAGSASSWYIVEVELPTFYTITYNFLFEGDTKYTQTAELAPGAAFPAMDVFLPYGVTSNFALPEGTVSESVEKNFALTVEHELPFEAAADVNSITTWYYAQMHGNASSTAYIQDNGEGTTNIEWADKSVDAAEIDSHLWGFAGDVWTGIKMVNKATGRAIVSTSGSAVMGDKANATAFIPTYSYGVYNANGWFCLKYPTSNYLNASGGQVNSYGDADNGSSLKMTKYQKKTVAVSEVGYSTLYLGYATYIPEGVEVYTVSAIEDGYVTLTLVEGDVLPANTGVILKNEGGYNFVTAGATATVTSLLNGTTTDTYVEGAAYVLAKGAQGVGLYKAELNKDADGNTVAEGTGTHFLNNANKAYLPASAVTGNAPMFSFDRGEGTTGIDNAQLTMDNVVIYDLLGRRVEKMEKGIYIVNGKKVIK